MVINPLRLGSAFGEEAQEKDAGLPSTVPGDHREDAAGVSKLLVLFMQRPRQERPQRQFEWVEETVRGGPVGPHSASPSHPCSQVQMPG